MTKSEYMNSRIATSLLETGSPDWYRIGAPWGEYDPLYNCILALVLRWEPHESVLDVGCYLGDFTARLKEVGFKNIVGADISTEAIKYARQRHPEISFIASDIFNLVFKDEFDLVVASGVLNFNHFTEAEYNKAIPKIHGFLHDRGYLIIQNPKSAMKGREGFTLKELDKHFQLIHHLKSTKYADYAYPSRREHGEHRDIRLYRKK
jgi:ubiquinone/menaquinone biosynthesis C-methylase UbiE